MFSNIQFSAIRHYRVNREKWSERLAPYLSDYDRISHVAHVYWPQPKEGEELDTVAGIILLDGADLEAFFEQSYNISLPKEKELRRNFVTDFKKMLSAADMDSSLRQKVLDYYDLATLDNRDAKGLPIIQIDLTV
jgi:hypothetical protein